MVLPEGRRPLVRPRCIMDETKMGQEMYVQRNTEAR